MPPIGSNVTRVTTSMLGNDLMSALMRTQQQMLDAQKKITSGKDFSRPSDAPSRVSAVMYLTNQLAIRDQQDRNLNNSLNVLNTTDVALNEATTLAMEAVSVGSSQIGIGSDETTRRMQAEVIGASLQGLMEVANRQYNELSVFGGNDGAAPDGVVFESFLGGVRYTGGEQALKSDVGSTAAEDFTSTGIDAFGALSSRVLTLVDLTPTAQANTRVAHIDGAAGLGVTGGSVELTVDGSAVIVDLTSVDTLGDVATRINDAIAGVDPAAGSLAMGTNGLDLTPNAGHAIRIEDIGAGVTARDLGIETDTTGPATTTGGDVGVRLTDNTRLADLGTAVDWASGLRIVHGERVETADFSAANTVEDVINVIEGLDLGLRARINEAGDGLDIVSEVSGVNLSIGENGGTTAEDLGLRTFGLTTELSTFRNNLGVETSEGEHDLIISLHDGRTFNVNLDGVTTVNDVLTAVNTAATTAGITTADFNMGLATTGNGFVLTDNTAGANEFTVANSTTSVAGDHLGITGASTGTTITGQDNAQVRVENVFTHLIDLRDSLLADDQPGIVLAVGRLENDTDSIVQARAVVGVQAKRIEDQQLRSEDQGLSERAMLSTLEDADLAEVLTEYSRLQLQLQASLQIGAQNMQLSLMDFLR